MKITGIIKNLNKQPITMDGRTYRYWCQIYQDANQRFPDGTWMLTSSVLREEGDLVYTTNAVYRK